MLLHGTSGLVAVVVVALFQGFHSCFSDFKSHPIKIFALYIGNFAVIVGRNILHSYFFAVINKRDAFGRKYQCGQRKRARLVIRSQPVDEPGIVMPVPFCCIKLLKNNNL